MNVAHPVPLMVIGFLLLVTGIVLPYGMIMGFLEPTLPMGFIAYGASFLGLVLGIIGLVFYSRAQH